MKNQYDMYKDKLDLVPEEEKLDQIYKWVNGDWIKVDTFKLLVGHVVYPNATFIDME